MSVFQSLCRLATTVALLSLVACDRPECVNQNPVFDRFSPSTAEYKSELARKIQEVGQDDLRYWFDRYEKSDTGEYIFVHAQGEGLCAVAHIRVDEWDEKMAGLRKTSGRGYSGAGLIGLRLRIEETSSGAASFEYAGLDRISD
jgi:hypothetical protein